MKGKKEESKQTKSREGLILAEKCSCRDCFGKKPCFEKWFRPMRVREAVEQAIVSVGCDITRRLLIAIADEADAQADEAKATIDNLIEILGSAVEFINDELDPTQEIAEMNRTFLQLKGNIGK